MKHFVPVLLLITIFSFVSCGGGKGGDPAPAPTTTTNTTTTGTTTGGTTSTTTGGGTTTVIPENQVLTSEGINVVLNSQKEFVSAKFGLINLTANTTSAITYIPGGNIKAELRNLSQGILTYEGDDYARVYYPQNVFRKGSTPALKDTATYVCEKITDPSAKNSSGQPIIKWMFFYDAGGAGDSGVGFVSAVKIGTLTGIDITKIITRTDLVVRP